RIMQKGTLRCRRSLWHQPHSRQTQNVVNTHSSGMQKRSTQQCQKWLETLFLQGPRRKGRQTPLLSLRMIQIRGGPHGGSGQYILRSGPGLTAARVGTNGQIGYQSYGHPRPKGGFLRLTHAFVGQPLQESMKMQLRGRLTRKRNSRRRIGLLHGCWPILPAMGRTKRTCVDRKSTRLNSSHVKISYAVFCM